MSLTWSYTLLLAVALPFGCADSGTTLERRGGPLPGEASAGADSGAGGSDSGAGGSDSVAVVDVPFCEALSVMRGKCQRCHQDPPRDGAPVPFLTYEDTQAPYYDTDKKFSDVMGSLVERDIMPYVFLNDGENPIMPPVEPLTSDEKATLVGWLEQGALPTGGTDCP